MKKELFLSRYNFSDADLKEAKIEWDELELIIKEYRPL